MLPYRGVLEAEMALQRNVTSVETAWLQYTGGVHDLWLYCSTAAVILLAYVLVPLPLAILELTRPQAVSRYKLQPDVRVPFSDVARYFSHVVRSYLLIAIPGMCLSYPVFEWAGMRTGLPLPSGWETAAQVVVYLLVEDYMTYWVHRAMHTRWGYERIHHVHHEFTAPVGFAATYAHWGELVLLGLPSFLGPALVPCHILTFWLWTLIRHVEIIHTHCGYDFPYTPSKFIPFYGGPEYHDYHHLVGGESRSNFASIFTYCDYIYGTNKGYRYRRQHEANVKERHTKPKNI